MAFVAVSATPSVGGASVTRRTIARASLVSLAGLFILFLMVWFVYRPWALNWGSTEEEIVRRMPGDEVVANPTFCATRAVTVEAPPEQVWPWILQIGYRRAGFYSYDRLDNDGIPSSEHILPEYQHLRVGDLVPLNKNAHARVTVLEPCRAMVLVFEVRGTWYGSTWAWGLYPVDASHTRLVTRLRVNVDSVRSQVILDLAEIIMMRRCLLGIKRRAESMASPVGGKKTPAT